MREIKFRAREINTGTWLIGSLEPKGDEASLAIFWACFQTKRLDVATLGQYTGLEDKNGKESYFDDVVKWRDSIFRIMWDDECATVMLKRLSGTDGMREIPAHNIRNSEVIGNIHENPELLEVK